MGMISLRYIANNDEFVGLYVRLLNKETLSETEKTTLLKLSVLFLNADDEFVRKLGYRIVLEYSNTYRDFTPLYDVAGHNGYTPIAKFIEERYEDRDCVENHFFNLFMTSYREGFKRNNIYLTEQQSEMGRDFAEHKDSTYAVVAPTSYGKSELMVESLNAHDDCNVCVLVPTKALLAQTKRRIVNSHAFKKNRKIITHPEMYIDGDTRFIGILTQERLLRLLQKKKGLGFGLIFVDEAHNLLENTPRARLLAIAIAVLAKRNARVAFKFLSPFLVNTSNLQVSHTDYPIVSYRIDEYLKVEKIFCCDFQNDGELKIYDQFINKFVSTGEERCTGEIDFLLKKRASKNIVYLNKPQGIEKLAKELLGKLPQVTSERLKKACADISEYLHKDYALIKCLECGVAYHHGSVPDHIRQYIEYLFSTEQELVFIVTSSTLLEGVNIPAEKLFVLDYTKGRSRLSPSQFKNLVGRVCRFSEIFNPNTGNLSMLAPEIYIVSSEYTRKGADIEAFAQNSMKADKEIKEKSENVLLKATDITDENKKDRLMADEFIENIEPGVVKSSTARQAKTEVGKSCFLNSVTEIDILAHETTMAERVKAIKDENIFATTAEHVIALINVVFIEDVGNTDFNLNRLKEEKARRFYTMFLNWRIKGATYNEMISSFLRYWKKRELSDEDEPLVYVNHWGDKTRDGGYNKLWVDIREKTHSERVNLAIVRIKEEQDFIDYQLIKYVEVLNDFKLIETDLYNSIKYGTSDLKKIVLIKNGITFGLATCLLKKYSAFITIDVKANTVSIKPSIIAEMEQNGENEILLFEARLNVREEA